MLELNKILLVDGSFLLHRALHSNGTFDLKNSKGQRTGGVFQFLRMLNKEIRESGQYFPVVVFDMGLAIRRVLLDPDYKKAYEKSKQDVVLTKEEVDNDYVTQYRKQRNVLSVILPYFGIPSIKFQDWEGDDLIYIISQIAKETVILTDDKDLLQLLSDKVSVRRPMAKEYWTLETFLKENDYSDIRDFVVYKALVGDKSDSIPSSCTGVGDVKVKDMIALIKLYMNTPDEYPKNSEALQSICLENNIKYHKAYINWDKQRFVTNLGLVDLSLVPIQKDLVDSIISTIYMSEKQCNYYKAIQSLSSLEVFGVDTDSLIREVKMRRSYLWY